MDFGGFHLALPDGISQSRPALGGYDGRRVIVGLRPEDMEDARLVSTGLEQRVIRGTVELREALGSDVVVHFSVDAPVVMTEDVKELAADVGEEAVQGLEQVSAHGKSVFLARLNPRTSARVGEPLDLYVDTGHLHFFDPESGLGIYGEQG